MEHHEEVRLVSPKVVIFSCFSRICVAVPTGFSTMIVAFASSIFSTAIPHLLPEFHISQEVATLGVTLYVLGFAIGPMLFAPASEIFGRRYPFMVSLVGFTAFSLGGAVSQSITALLVCRFLAGTFGAGPLVLVPTIFSDLFVEKSLGVSMLAFSFVVFSGPALAQPIGGFIVINDRLGWRWTQYVCAILGALCLVINACLRETNIRIIERKNAGLNSDQPKVVDSRPLSSYINEYFALPLKLLISEPIVLLVCLFGSYVYALLYLCLSAYPAIFQRVHHWNQGIAGLPYLALMLGQFLGCLGIFTAQGIIMSKAKGQPPAGKQLIMAGPGALAFGIGLIWLGWSGYRKDIHWIVPTLSGVFSGFGMLAAFIPSITFLVQLKPEW